MRIFFNVTDMNAFAAGAKNLAEQGNLYESDDGSPASDETTDNKNMNRLHYSDLFDDQRSV